MAGNSYLKVATRDPWLDLVQRNLNVPLEKVMSGLEVPSREAVAIKDELMEQVTRIIEASDQEAQSEA